jgi:hypothetical protein
MQKSTYILFVPLLILQAITGLALWRLPIPIVDTSLYNLAAGLIGAEGIFWVRTGHYVINWLFIILTTIHVYLSVTEDFPAFLDFFGLSVFGRKGAHGEEQDEEAAEPAPSYASAEHG